MRQRIDQFFKQLPRGDLAPVYLLTGDEPLQLLEAEDAIRSQALREGIEERLVYHPDRSFDWDQLIRDGASPSLFASRRLIELRLGAHKPGKPGGAVLTDWAGGAGGDNILLISATRLDRKAQQARWFKALDKAGIVVQIWPIAADRLPAWISQRMQAMGRRLDRDAAELIAQRTEGNLLAARQELEKLCLLLDKDRISLDDVMHAIVDSARHDVFALIENVYQGRVDRAAAMLRGLRREGAEPMSLFGALMWEFRRTVAIAVAVAAGEEADTVFGRYQVWPQRRAALTAVLRRHSPGQLGRLLAEAGTVDRALKGAAREDSWDVLEDFMFHIAGAGVQS